jgi:hypothetical protein
MAKHDQRILKFLTQNAERAPTITDMMTRLNISISDITSSLNSLMAQGMVSKRTNGQGIECWFPTTGSSPQLGNDVAQEPRGSDYDRRATDSRFGTGLGGLNSPNPPEPSPLPPLQPTLPSLSASSAFPASLTAGVSPAGSQRSPARESAVFSASPSAAAANSPTGSSSFSPAGSSIYGSAPSSPAPAASVPAAPALEALPGITPPVGGYAMAPAKSGIGFFTFAVGIIAAAAAAVFLSGRLVKQDIKAATQGYADKATVDEAISSWTAFEKTTKTHVKALEAQVKTLTDDLATMKAKNDSLEALAAKGAADAKKAEAAAAKKPVRRKR